MFSNNLRRAGIATAATSIALGSCIVGAAPASAETRFNFERVAGDNRYETAAKAAAKFGKADTVIVASGENFPDALTANYLAGVKGAPVLLTKKGETPAAVKQAITDSGAKNVIIVGGTGVISQAQQDSLDKDYDSVSRIAGDDRWATASAVIAAGDEAETDTALLATGHNFPDALGGGAVAFGEKMPLAITRTDDAPDNVVRALKDAGISKVLVLGGKDVVSDAVIEELKSKGITLEGRLAGTDRSETSRLLAEHALKNFGFSPAAVNVASGATQGGGADALGGGSLSGKQNRPLLITKTASDPGTGVTTYLQDHRTTLTEGIIFGGTGAVTGQAEYEMYKAVLGSGALNARTGEYYNDVQSAIGEAEKNDTIKAFGPDLPGFTVNKPDITIVGDGASLKQAIVVQGVDNVRISGFTITPSNVGGQWAGIYLNNAEGVDLSDVTVKGTDGQTGAGVINEIGGEKEIAKIHDSAFSDLRQGVYANPTAEFTITKNEFVNNAAGSANDVASVISDNRFINNDEGVGLGGPGATVTGNYFANNDPNHVGDYTQESSYHLQAMIGENQFDEPVEVRPAEDSPTAPEFIVDKG